MAETKAGGVYLAADGETLIDANGNAIEKPKKEKAEKAEKE